jgi:hypothetical protein
MVPSRIHERSRYVARPKYLLRPIRCRPSATLQPPLHRQTITDTIQLLTQLPGRTHIHNSPTHLLCVA